MIPTATPEQLAAMLALMEEARKKAAEGSAEWVQLECPCPHCRRY